MGFPDKKYIQSLLVTDQKRFNDYSNEAKLLAFSGVFLNSVANFVLDESISWKKQTLKINDLYLTGTNPVYNKVIIEQAKSSPIKLRELLKTKVIKKVFNHTTSSNRPILVIREGKKLKIFDGMHRVISALLKNELTIIAYVGTYKSKPKQKCEPHVVYDLIKAYKRSAKKDKKGLVTSLKFLKHSYVNVEHLLKERLNSKYLPNPDIEKIIALVLKK